MWKKDEALTGWPLSIWFPGPSTNLLNQRGRPEEEERKEVKNVKWRSKGVCIWGTWLFQRGYVNFPPDITEEGSHSGWGLD